MSQETHTGQSADEESIKDPTVDILNEIESLGKEFFEIEDKMRDFRRRADRLGSYALSGWSVYKREREKIRFIIPVDPEGRGATSEESKPFAPDQVVTVGGWGQHYDRRVYRVIDCVHPGLSKTSWDVHLQQYGGIKVLIVPSGNVFALGTITIPYEGGGKGKPVHSDLR